MRSTQVPIFERFKFAVIKEKPHTRRYKARQVQRNYKRPVRLDNKVSKKSWIVGWMQPARLTLSIVG